MNYNKADFIASYGISSQLPESDRPELSFSGRSNVGKSSLINKLCNRKNLARVSSTPGKTATINFYAVERVSDVVVAAVERAMAEEVHPENLRFIVGDAKTLTEWFPPHTFDCIYLNFSDPWPKAGHYKRRLTYRAFLELYKSLLKEGGVLRLKTDNAGLFDFSLGEFEAAGMDVVKCSRDLHASPFAEGNVMTEYETNFTAKGMPIYFAEVRVK